MRIVWAAMLSLLFIPGLLSPAAAAEGSADPKAVTELERAEKLYSEDKPQDAVKIALAQVDGLQKAKDFDHLVDCLFLIGNCYYEMGDWKRAEQFMRNANDLGWQTFPDQMGTGALKVIADCQLMQNDLEGALKTYQERVQKLKKQTTGIDQGDLAGALFDVGSMMVNLQRPAEALPLFKEAQTANEAAAKALAAAGATSQQDDKDANAIDHAEIVYHQGIALFAQDKFAECRKQLEVALQEFDAVQATKREDVSDRLVAVLDDLVLTSEKLSDNKAAEEYRARRDKLNQ
jgi:tetratricopeptide (TPR) repeat protein